jgi:hypothetical protein
MNPVPPTTTTRMTVNPPFAKIRSYCGAVNGKGIDDESQTAPIKVNAKFALKVPQRRLHELKLRVSIKG